MCSAKPFNPTREMIHDALDKGLTIALVLKRGILLIAEMAEDGQSYIWVPGHKHGNSPHWQRLGGHYVR